MTRFRDLPDHMLLAIIETTSAGDISSLASCCHGLHYLSQERLKFHRDKRAEAQEIRLGGAPPYTSPYSRVRYASAIHPLKHLQDIFENDDIRFHTRVINISDLGPMDPEGTIMVDEKKFIASMTSQYEPQISALVAEVYDALLPHAEKVNLREWTDKVISGEREAVVILLLALYPYINILEIEDASLDWFNHKKAIEERESMPHEHGNEAPWVNLFRSLTATASEPGTNRLKIFSKLSKFCLQGEEYQEHFQDDLGSVTPFMTVPTMRRIRCHNLAGSNVPWPYDVATSNVTSLTLSGFVDIASLGNVISGLKSLKDFWYHIINPQWETDQDWRRHDYRDRMKWGPHLGVDDIANIEYSDPDEDYSGLGDKSVEYLDQVVDADLPRWEPRAITECLLQYACNSLVSLDLGAFSFKRVSVLSNEEPFIPSLRPFQVLTHVHLDTMMLFEKVERPEIISVIGKDSIRRRFRQTIKAQKLIDFLPSSIEEVCITCEYVGKGLSKRDVEAMFTGLPEQKDRLPKLSKLRVKWMGVWNSSIPRNLEAEREGWEELIQRCQDNEIELSSNGEEGQPPSEAFEENYSDSDA